MFAWGMVSLFQAWMQDTWSFYLTRALIGVFEGKRVDLTSSALLEQS